MVNLYTEEYFGLIREHLVPGGYATYWLPVHQLKPLDTLAIVKAFCNAFEDCSLWSGGGLEWMLMGSNHATGPVAVDTFSAQWHDARVGPELTALGFETPEQMGSLFMADARELGEVTRGVNPVTDNYPLRLSDELPASPERVALYARLMDEDRRLELFRSSPFIAARWPHELVARSEPFFRYERMLKDFLTNGVYRDDGDPSLWEEVDDALGNTSLQTLPLWLLGSDRDAQRIAAELERRGETRGEVDIELAIGALSRRDFAGALALSQRAIGDGRAIPVLTVTLLVYVLAKNDRLADANAILGSIDPAKAPEVRSLRAWFEAKFGPVTSTSQADRTDAPLNVAAR